MQTRHVLHLVGNVDSQVCRRATGAPGDVTEQRPEAGHAILSVEQVLNALRIGIIEIMLGATRPCDALLVSCKAAACLTSSVRGGKNSNEKKGLPVAAASLILSAIFMAAAGGVPDPTDATLMQHVGQPLFYTAPCDDLYSGCPPHSWTNQPSWTLTRKRCR